MTRNQIRQAIEADLRAGHLAGIASAGELLDAAILVENHLVDRLPPLRPWQRRAGVTALTREDLHPAIKAEFQRLFDQLKTPPKTTPVRPDPAIGTQT